MVKWRQEQRMVTLGLSHIERLTRRDWPLCWCRAGGRRLSLLRDHRARRSRRCRFFSPATLRLPVAKPVAGILFWAAWLIAVLGCGHARPYPNRAITIVCPWAAGGGTDRLARFLASALQKELNAPCIVANKTGGAGAIGHQAGAMAKPDGYTLTLITFELCTMHRMGIASIRYQDFDCLMQWNADPAAIIVRRDAKWKDLREFLDDARQRPGQIKMSGTARGGAWDLARAGLLLANRQPVQDILWVPTQGAAPALVDLLGGHVDAVCCSIPEAATVAQELRVLAVMAESRLEQYPDVPTCREAGIDWVAVGWRGIAAPRGMPDNVRRTLLRALDSIAASDEFRAFMNKNGFAIKIRKTEEFTAFLAQEDNRWKKTIEQAGFYQ